MIPDVTPSGVFYLPPTGWLTSFYNPPWSFNQKALKDFKKNLDKSVQRRIINWLDKHIEGSNNPRVWGKALEGELGTLWRYRIGSYRIIADIQDEVFTVVVVKAGKRNNVYKRKR